MFVGDFFMTERVFKVLCLTVVTLVGLVVWLIDRHSR
jgi:hypothetical protein